jgi:hypothetical protein
MSAPVWRGCTELALLFPNFFTTWMCVAFFAQV